MEEKKEKDMSHKGKDKSGRSLPKPQGCTPHGASARYSRGKLGESLVQKTPGFDLSDPYMNVTPGTYSSLHDPCLKKFFSRPGKKKHLVKQGLVAEDEKVLCSRKEFSQYMDYTRAVQNKWRKPCPSETAKRHAKGVAGQKVEQSVLQTQKSKSRTSRTSGKSAPSSTTSEDVVAETPEVPLEKTLPSRELPEVIPDLTGTHSPTPFSIMLPVTRRNLEVLSKILVILANEVSEASNRLDVLETILSQSPDCATLDSSASEESSSSCRGTSTSSPSNSLRGTKGSSSILSDTPFARQDQAGKRETDSLASAVHQYVEDNGQSQIQIPAELDDCTTCLVDCTLGPCDRVGPSHLQVVSVAPPETVSRDEEHPREATGSEPKKEENRVQGFFRRVWKAVKKTFLCCNCTKKIHPA